jgi:hypothetical protein
VVCITEKINSFRVLVGNPEGKRVLGKHTCRYENTTINLKEIWCENTNWIYLAQDGVMWWALLNSNETLGSIK